MRNFDLTVIQYGELLNRNPSDFGVGLISGATTGIIGTVLGNPFYVAKTRLQSQV